MPRFSLPLLISSLAALTACETMDIASMTDALLLSPSDETKAEISTIVSEALNGTRVLVAPDSLTTRSTLSIDPAGSGHPIAGGRLMGKPDHFDLKMSGKTCYLVHRQSGEVYRVKTATCRAAES